jgi:hypothetical protein
MPPLQHLGNKISFSAKYQHFSYSTIFVNIETDVSFVAEHSVHTRMFGLLLHTVYRCLVCCSIIISSFIFFRWIRASFLEFFSGIPQRPARGKVSSRVANPTRDWQSAVDLGDAGFESGTAGHQSGGLSVSCHISLGLPHLPQATTCKSFAVSLLYMFTVFYKVLKFSCYIYAIWQVLFFATDLVKSLFLNN